MGLSETLDAVYGRLLEAFGHRGWWPGETPFEVMVGAILTQRTNWGNVEKAISALESADALDPHAISQMTEERLQELVRPAGYFRQKAERLKRLCSWLLEASDGDVDALSAVSTAELRRQLLALRGVGPETADSILLYALERPVFVVDTYTMRVVVRHELIHVDCTYEELQDLFTSALPEDVELFKDYHAQLVEVGKRYCRPSPRCGECPLISLLGEPALDERN